jgi:hypothetical protein
MKNVIKKIAGIAMAFILLGTGTALTGKLLPGIQTILTASAATCTKCHGGSYWVTSTSQQVGSHVTVYHYTCGLCGNEWSSACCNHGKERRYTSDWEYVGAPERKSWYLWAYNYSKSYEDYCPYCNKVLAYGKRYKHLKWDGLFGVYIQYEDDKPSAY